MLSFWLIALSLVPSALSAVDDSKAAAVPPFEELLRRPVNLRPELQGKHPRIFFTNESLKALRERARESSRDLWQETVRGMAALKENPPAPGDAILDKSGNDSIQYTLAYRLSEATFAYSIEQDQKYLDAARKYLLTIIKYDPWGYTFRTPNVDLPPAHLLYAVAFAYDGLYDKLNPSERDAVRAKLARQGHLMYEYFKYKPKKRYSYSQNHTFIPMTGLAVAAFALMGEEKEAQDWAQLARAVYDRVLLTFGTDGYYYEGYHYSVFSLHWIVRYLDALEHMTGEDLYPQMRERFLPLKYYVAHSILPDGQSVFDFGDTGRGASDRNDPNQEKLNTAYEVLYRLAAKYKDAEAQGVADYLRRELKTKTWERHWAFYSYDANLKPAPISAIPTSYYFRDNDTVFWRSGWNKEATAFAFRCGPPEGHHFAELASLVPDWRQNTGHAHPDANSFIIYAHGKYLTGDTGYTGVKLTSDHNTVIVDGRGEANEGRHEMFKDVPYKRLNEVRIGEVWSTPDYFYARGEASAAYYPELGLTRFERNFLYVAPDYFVVWDELSADQPREFSWLLNADQNIKSLSPAQYLLQNGDAALFVERLAPSNAGAIIEPQIVISQGRPGEVENGEKEQRGFQLIERTAERVRNVEFLNFLQPVIDTDSNHASRPQSIAPLVGNARGLSIGWPGGEKEIVLLAASKESVEGLKTDAARAVLRASQDGAWRRLILQDGTKIEREGKGILIASSPVNAAFVMKNEAWRGTLSATAATEVILNVPRTTRSVRVNGSPVNVNYDAAGRTIRLKLNAGVSRIESE